jgi:mannose/fructose/N-acetylgalactosamine-specific phosphotransferase system component IIC
MISRPLVSAILVGVLVGRPVEALFMGTVLELFVVVILPVGAARYPESGTAAVAATAAYVAATPVFSPSLALLAVLFALLWEHVGGMSVILARRFNERFVALAPAAPQPDTAYDQLLERRHRLALAVDFLRAVLVTAVGFLIGGLALRVLAGVWSLSDVIVPAILSIGMACMVGAALPLFGGLRAQKLAFGIGLTLGLFILLLR